MNFQTFFEPEQLAAYQRGVMRYKYRGVPCLKSPLDLAIYLRLLWDTQPRSLIEIGSKAGGSALLFRDLTRTLGLDCNITSIDLVTPALELDGVRFLQGNVCDLGEVFAREGLDDLPRPWLTVEDSAHSYEGCSRALEFFADRLQQGEYLVMEDGVLEDLGLAEKYGGGPNRAIADFLDVHPRTFSVDRTLCDMFGPNATYNPNGYLKRL